MSDRIYAFGLFEYQRCGLRTKAFQIPMKDRVYVPFDKIDGWNGGSPEKGSSYSELADKKSGDRSLLEFLYNDSLEYAAEYVRKNPEWKIGLLMKDEGLVLGARVTHAYAYKRAENGHYTFADVRGETDNIGEFFAEFSMSPRRSFILDEDHPTAPSKLCNPEEAVIGGDHQAFCYDYWLKDAESMAGDIFAMMMEEEYEPPKFTLSSIRSGQYHGM